MAKLTIAQLRERAVEKLATYKNPNPTWEDLEEAKRNMNSLYRLNSLATRNLYLLNDEHTCNLWSTKKSEEREYKWGKRLDCIFYETYGLKIVSTSGYSYFPGVVDNNGAVYQKIEMYFYN